MIRITCPNCGNKTEDVELVHGRCHCGALLLGGEVHFADAEPAANAVLADETEPEEDAEEAAVAGDAGGPDGAGEAEGAAEGVAGSEADDR